LAARDRLALAATLTRQTPWQRFFDRRRERTFAATSRRDGRAEAVEIRYFVRALLVSALG
jgi:hypothetical protein